MSDLTLEEEQDRIRLKKIADNTLVLANIIELTSSTIARVNGKDAEYSKENLTRSVLSNIVAKRLKVKLKECIKC